MGGTGWGRNFWGKGTWGLGIIPPVENYEVLSFSESLTVWVPLRLEGVQALTSTLVEVTFSHDLDFSYGPNLDPTSYVIGGLMVDDVSPGPTDNTVRLTTSEQGNTIYNLLVTDAHSYAGDPIDPNFDDLDFAGFPAIPTFFAAAQSNTKVQLVFSVEMLQNAAFSDTASYEITKLDGTSIPISSVTIFGPTPVRRLDLELGSALTPGQTYVVNILDPTIESASGLAVYPTTDIFKWEKAASWVDGQPLNIDIDRFSGEVSGGLLGQPLGQVFFSPALEASAANSSIQLDEVSVCTRAYDVYTIPELPDPAPLTTFGGTSETLIGEHVLWAPAPRLGLASFTMVDLREDTWGGATDGPADAELVETIDTSRAAFLNVLDYRLFPATPSATDSTALTFDGVDEYVTMGNVLGSTFEYNVAFSISFWFKATTVFADMTLVSKIEGATTYRGFELRFPSGFSTLYFRLTNDEGTSDYVEIRTTAGGWTDNQWHHVVVTKATGYSVSGGDFHIYIDGVGQTLTTLRDALTGTTATANALMVGARDVVGTERYFDGEIDDVAVYDKELSASEVSWVYGAGTPPDLTDASAPSNLVGYWRMGDGASYPTIPDDSANSNDGTMTNMEAADLVGGAPLLVFRTADNQTPIGPGPTVNINLQP